MEGLIQNLRASGMKKLPRIHRASASVFLGLAVSDKNPVLIPSSFFVPLSFLYQE